MSMGSQKRNGAAPATSARAARTRFSVAATRKSAPTARIATCATVQLATAIQKISWVLYDWANSGYGLIVISAVFSPYFIRQLLPVIPELSHQ